MPRVCQYSKFHPSDKNAGSRTSEASVDLRLRLRLRPLVPRPSRFLSSGVRTHSDVDAIAESCPLNCQRRVRVVSSRSKQASIAQRLSLRHQNK